MMMGPTGSGKTEIARRLARLSHAPFFKTEVTKFTEVGIHGKDTDSLIQDLVEVAIKMERDRRTLEVQPLARKAAEAVLVEAVRSMVRTNKSLPELRNEISRGIHDKLLVEIELEREVPSSSLHHLMSGLSEDFPEFDRPTRTRTDVSKLTVTEVCMHAARGRHVSAAASCVFSL